MSGFSDFESLVSEEAPSKSQLVQDVEALHDLVTYRYTTARYEDFANEKYDAWPAETNSYDFLRFQSCLTESEAWELYEWCSASARTWIGLVCDRIERILAKDDTAIQDYADTLRRDFIQGRLAGLI